LVPADESEEEEEEEEVVVLEGLAVYKVPR
jgi:hypothetical protein